MPSSKRPTPDRRSAANPPRPRAAAESAAYRARCPWREPAPPRRGSPRVQCTGPTTIASRRSVRIVAASRPRPPSRAASQACAGCSATARIIDQITTGTNGPTRSSAQKTKSPRKASRMMRSVARELEGRCASFGSLDSHDPGLQVPRRQARAGRHGTWLRAALPAKSRGDLFPAGRMFLADGLRRSGAETQGRERIFVERIRLGGRIEDPTAETVLQAGNVVAVAGARSGSSTWPQHLRRRRRHQPRPSPPRCR